MVLARQESAFNYLFFVAVWSLSVILVFMKVRELKVRKPILFTKSRPFKMKNKTLDRKLKHKKKYEY